MDLEDDIVAACLMTHDGEVGASKPVEQEEDPHGYRQSHHHQPHHFRAGDLRGLPRGLDCHSSAAHAADGGDQCHFSHRHCRRHAGCGADGNDTGYQHGRAGCGAGIGQHLRWVSGDPPHAGDVQEKREEVPAADKGAAK